MADPFLQDAVRWQPYCVFDPLGFQNLINFGIGEPRVGPQINARDFPLVSLTGCNYVATIKASGSRQFRRRSNFLEQVKMKNMLITAMMIAISTPALSQAQYVPQTCAYGYYLNAENVCVHKPTAVPHEGATALCRDRLYSYATRGPDICANHGGIAELLR